MSLLKPQELDCTTVKLSQQFSVTPKEWALEFDWSHSYARAYFRTRFNNGDPDFVKLSPRKLRTTRERLLSEKKRASQTSRR